MKRLYVFFAGLAMLSGLQAQTYADHSVLSSGTWYKIAVTEPGVYRLDAAFLGQLGINIASIDPRQIGIFGHGGGMLPQQNSAFRHDDLKEIPIQVVGESDGRFDGADYVQFYAEGPHTWAWSSESQRFRHSYHFYSDTTFYFVNVGLGSRRVALLNETRHGAIGPVSAAGMRFHEIDNDNPIKSGRYWLGELFELNTPLQRSFYLPDALPGGKIMVQVQAASHADVPTTLTIRNNGQVIGTLDFAATNVTNKESRYYYLRSGTYQLDASTLAGDSLKLSFTYNNNGSFRADGWLDWIEVNYDQRLDAGNQSQWFFNLSEGVGPGQAADLNVASVSGIYQFWDITDPTEVRAYAYTLDGSTARVRLPADSVKRFVAFRPINRPPHYAGRVANQDLHGMALVDYLIIAHPDFMEAAERLADFHATHYQRSTAIVTPAQIYNEFSAGSQDVSAIRDFIRMLYLKSGKLSPGFVCLFGDGTYIYKNISTVYKTDKSFIPTYQSRDSWDPVDSYTSDDYFVILDENEGYWGEGSGIDGDQTRQVNLIDVPIGRLPVETIEEAQTVVDKIIAYATAPEGLGVWRNRVVLVADHKDGEGNTHVRQANGYTNLIYQGNPCINVEKVYMDNYKMVISAGQESFPEGRQALLDALDAGGLIVNYTGHGSELAWSNAYVYKNTDIARLQNFNRLPAIVTATCEYGRYDDPGLRSGGELMLLQPGAGAIAMLTTVRLVFSTPNETLNQNFYRHVFTFDSLKGRMPTIGEVMMRTKNSTFPRGDLSNINSRNFTLMGDPGLILNYPGKRARITSINGQPLEPGVVDTLRSLGKVQVRGLVEDELGRPMPDFLGEMDITVFDKPSQFTTLRSQYTFQWQKNRIFNGKATVREGAFTFEFVVPIDISYEDGMGKISVYFYDLETDGMGCHDRLYVGGTDPDAILDDAGPEVRLFMNDSLWVDGSMTGPNPFLYALLRDASGINTVGNGIGHEITAVLDGDFSRPFILNDYYTSRFDSYQEGSVRYQLKDLAEGEHTLQIRVWDVANNNSTAETSFIVADDAQVAIDRILNAPNPFYEGQTTTFYLAHNQEGKALDLTVDIYDLSGRHIKHLEGRYEPGSTTSSSMVWDGRTDAGAPIGGGVYIYQVILKDPATGRQEAETRRLIYLRQ
ncbi:MAG: type IX secretion system sortase PorU [Bacteroidia bacterium]